MIDLKNEEVRAAVREHYALIARGESTRACGCSSDCCSNAEQVSQAVGYGIQALESLPDGANLGLGCGNPQAIAALKPGETVVDLGSGGGIDCFLAARSVGPQGMVIGVDMTPDMLRLARTNAAKGDFDNVDFRLGEIEHLPVADSSVDVILSNCVINLSPDKAQVLREAFRVLKSGGRLAVSDMVASGPLPESIRGDLEKHSQCIAGAAAVGDLEAMLKDAGFTKIRIQPKSESKSFVKDWAPETGIEEYVVSATIEAVRP